MGDTETTAAVVGACGGAGATRLTVEVAGTLARAGESVAVLDAAAATQGLAGYVPGRIDPDLTRVLLEDDCALPAALVDLDLPVPGRAAVAPIRAPFERLARAETAGAARSLTDLLAGPTVGQFDHVLVDVPPVATNLAVAAATASDRVTVVAPPGERGADAVQLTRGRLADVGSAPPGVVVDEATGRGERALVDADATVPESDLRAPSEAPAVVDHDPAFAQAVAAATEGVAGVAVDRESPDQGLLDGVR